MNAPARPRYASDTHTLALLVHPGQPGQRALRTVPSNRPDLRELAVRRARNSHGDAPLAWFNHNTGEVTPA